LLRVVEYALGAAIDEPWINALVALPSSEYEHGAEIMFWKAMGARQRAPVLASAIANEAPTRRLPALANNDGSNPDIIMLDAANLAVHLMLSTVQTIM
jgi:hypothetical protein